MKRLTAITSIVTLGCLFGCSSAAPQDPKMGPVSKDPASAPQQSNPAAKECAVDGAHCSTQAGFGLCAGGSCSTCTDVTDDSKCAATYGDGHMCMNGACIAASCRTTADCAGNSQLCAGNQCTACATDVDCFLDAQYGFGFMCQSGSCKSAACNTPNAACPFANGYECCDLGANAIMCVPGECCDDSQCQAPQTCQDRHCQ